VQFLYWFRKITITI